MYLKLTADQEEPEEGYHQPEHTVLDRDAFHQLCGHRKTGQGKTGSKDELPLP